MLSGAASASAQEPGQVQGLTAEQGDGFTALAWQPVEGATDYQIERTRSTTRTRRPVPR